MKRLFLLLFVIMAMTGAAIAQTRTVTGSVINASDNEPVIGASVKVTGTDMAAVTDIDGRFSIPGVPMSAKTITVSFIGMTTQEVPIHDGEIKVALGLNAQMLDEVVVTALGMSRSEKSLGYAATQVGAAEIERAQSTSVMGSLQGKVAGLQIQQVSSQPGSNMNVTIRGIGSINGSNQPLYVVDGVPMGTSHFNDAGNQLSTSGVANLSPDDIASLTVLKGAAATALYGSRASNGVIMITTKSGSGGDGKNYTITYSGNVVASRVTLLPEMQNEFGQGWNGKQTFIENGSWGPRFDGSQQQYGFIYNNSQLTHKYSAVKNNVKDFFDTGWSQNHSVALSGQSRDRAMTYYMSYNYTYNNGMIPTDQDSYRRNSFSFRGSYQPEKWLKVSSTVNYATYRTKAVRQYQGTSVIDGILELPRDVSIVDMKDLSNPFNTPQAYFTPYGITNPYWSLNNNKAELNGKQVFGKIQLDINPIDELRLTYRFGFDYSDYDNKTGYPQIEVSDDNIQNDYGYAPSNMNQDGWVYAYYNRRHELNHDFMANYAKKFIDQKFDVNVTAGLSINERYSTYMNGEKDVLSIPTGFWDLSNGATFNTLTEGQSKRRLVGLYGDIALGWDDWIFMDVTMRNDWSSTLPKGNNSYFYPGVTLSGIFTKFVPANDVLTFGKIRLAYGKTGNDASPYYTDTNYIAAYTTGYYTSPTVQFPLNGVNAFMASATSGSNTLRPEMTTEFEAGANLKFFNGRIDVDFSYYNRTTKDQIFSLPVDPATGFTTKVVNFGEVRNTGVELMVNFIPVQTRNFTWELGFNWARNRNKVLSLPEEITDGKVSLTYFSTSGKEAIYLYAEKDKPLGTFWTYMPQYTDDGKIICNEYGQPILGDNLEYTGLDMNNKWIGGITTSFSAYGVTLSAALDVRYGGHMMTRTANLMYFTGNGTMSTLNDREPFVLPNSVIANGDGTYRENTVPLYTADQSFQNYFSSSSYGQGGMQYMINRSYAKLRNVSLTWQLPRKWLKAMCLSDLAITAYGNNLFTWRHKSNVYCDPETSTTTTNDVVVGFGQPYYANPSAREYGMNLKVTF